MQTNLGKYKQDIERLVEKGNLLFNDLPPKEGHMGVVCSCGGLQLA